MFLRRARANCRGHTGQWLVGICGVLCIIAACGCTTVEVSVTPNATQRTDWTVAVFPLDETPAGSAVADFTIYGYTGSPGSGAAIAHELKWAFSAHREIRIVTREVFHQTMRQEGLSIRELPALDGPRACASARAMKADMLVLGRVLRYRTSWLLFFPKTSVAFELRGLDPTTGDDIWNGRAKRSALFSSPGPMTRTLAVRLAAEVARSLCNPAQR